jgi:hypothetical protein
MKRWLALSLALTSILASGCPRTSEDAGDGGPAETLHGDLDATSPTGTDAGDGGLLDSGDGGLVDAGDGGLAETLPAAPDAASSDTNDDAQLPLSTGSTYAVEHHLDLTLCMNYDSALINFLVDLFYNPGESVVDLTVQHLSLSLPDDFDDPACLATFQSALTDAVDAWLLQNSPDYVQELFLLGQDLFLFAHDLELHGEMTLTLVDEWFLKGSNHFDLLKIHWNGGVHELTPEQLASLGYPFALADSAFTAMVANHDVLIIDTHTIDLSPGALELLVIEKLLLPSVSPYDSISAMKGALMDCAALAAAVDPLVLECMGAGTADLVESCNATVDFLFEPILEMSAGLLQDQHIRLHGKCHLADDDGDLLVDRLVNGLWFGHEYFKGEEAGQVDGTFEGTVVLP